MNLRAIDNVSERSDHGMNPQHRRPRSSARSIRFELRALLVVGVLAAVVCGLIVLAGRGSGHHAEAGGANPEAAAVAAQGSATGGDSSKQDPATQDPALQDPALQDPALSPDATSGSGSGDQDLDGAEPSNLISSGTCTMTVKSVRVGDTGPSVSCVQKALAASGFYSGGVTGTFDEATSAAVRAMQVKRDMFVDGVVGRETAISIGVWPDELSQVVHTPKPAAGAKDLLGYKLSSVATSGPDAPPLPAASGSGKRLVYSRAGLRVWAVDKDGQVIRSWLVTGSKYSNEMPGVHQVFSKSEQSTAWNGKAILPQMVRYQKTKIGNIGFHGIPIHVADGTPYQTDAELGTRLSGGCQRQANLDANFVWAFAQIGTPVVVI